MGSGISNMWLFATPIPWVTCRGACAMRQSRFIMGRPISKLPLIITAQLPESWKVNRQYGSGIPNMWLFVTPLPWVTCQGACALRQKRLMGSPVSKYPQISPQPSESCKVNRQYGVRDSTYVVICDAPTLRHVTQRMCIAPKLFIMGRLISKLPLIVTAAP